jgi:hypothetical protein
MSMPMKTRFRATFLPLAACSALALMGACSDVTAPQPAAPSQARAGFVPARSNFGGYFGAQSIPLDTLGTVVVEEPDTFGTLTTP